MRKYHIPNVSRQRFCLCIIKLSRLQLIHFNLGFLNGLELTLQDFHRGLQVFLGPERTSGNPEKGAGCFFENYYHFRRSWEPRLGKRIHQKIEEIWAKDFLTRSRCGLSWSCSWIASSNWPDSSLNFEVLVSKESPNFFNVAYSWTQCETG